MVLKCSNVFAHEFFMFCKDVSILIQVAIHSRAYDAFAKLYKFYLECSLKQDSGAAGLDFSNTPHIGPNMSNNLPSTMSFSFQGRRVSALLKSQTKNPNHAQASIPRLFFVGALGETPTKTTGRCDRTKKHQKTKHHQFFLKTKQYRLALAVFFSSCFGR